MPVRTDECNRYAIVQSRYSCPFPCAFLPSTVSDFGQQVSAIRVLVLQNICSDLNKEGIQLCFIPLVKSLRRKQELMAYNALKEEICLFEMRKKKIVLKDREIKEQGNGMNR